MPENLLTHKLDLASCEAEPIHIPGTIQPHGHLLGLDKRGLTVSHYSAALPKLLGRDPSEFAGATLHDLLPLQIYERLDDQLASGVSGSQPPLRCELGDTGEPHDLTLHDNGSHFILEFESIDEDLSTELSLEKLEDLIGELHAQRDQESLQEKAADIFKRVAGYDRVMVYRFDADWNGKVVAESKNAQIPPYLGLNYPASDIPAQARKLYETNLVRVLVDVEAIPTPLMQVDQSDGAARSELDLGAAALRAVSPIHLQYLRNMKVGATLTLSILVEGRLWGLVACHHSSPRRLSPQRRTVCRLLVGVFANSLAQVSQHHESRQGETALSTVARLAKQAQEAKSIIKGFTEFEVTLADLIDCDGAAIVRDESVATIGTTPDPARLRELIRFGLISTKDGLYQTNCLPAQWDSSDHSLPGVLMATLDGNGSHALIWFRKEVSQEVEWAGDPRKEGDSAAGGSSPLTPRKSFETWIEIVSGKSIPWSDQDLASATLLRSRSVDLLVQQSHQMEQLNEKIRSINEGLESFSYSVSHELKAPIRRIQGFAEIIRSELQGQNADILDRLLRNTDRMDTLIETIIMYARIGYIEKQNRQHFDVGAMLERLLRELLASGSTALPELVVNPIPKAFGNLPLLRQLFENLLSNAIKYTSKTDSPRIELSGEGREHTTLYCLSDNGIGFDMAYHDDIFEVFHRLNKQAEYEGSGIGLATAKRIAEMHGGRLWAESSLGKGATFFVEIPTADSQPG